jgi:hypothetical protein
MRQIERTKAFKRDYKRVKAVNADFAVGGHQNNRTLLGQGHSQTPQR